jgi:DNA-binding HxlR family transcriptional regulator
MAVRDRASTRQDTRPAGGDGHTGLHLALGRVGDRWSLLVVQALLVGPRRFNELQAELMGIAPNVLAARLRQLEGDGLVVATPYSERPVRYAYELTADGAALAGALRLLTTWGAAQAGAPAEAEPVVHQACGTAAEPRWWCPTCERGLDDDELDDLRWI